MPQQTISEMQVEIQIGPIVLDGDLSVPAEATGLVLFAHGSGSSRFSSRNRFVAQWLRERGLGTLLFDLLTADEDRIDQETRAMRFNTRLLADRLAGATGWLQNQDQIKDMNIGYFGASTGSAAALIAAAENPDTVRAVVSRGGRPDLAQPYLPQVHAATLLIVGGYDFPVIDMNQEAFEQLPGEKAIEIVPRATHLFEEPGALEEVSRLAADWFERYLGEAGSQ